MTTQRELDIMQVEAQSVVWDAFQKWMADKLGPRAQGVENVSNPGWGNVQGNDNLQGASVGQGNGIGAEGVGAGGAQGANVPPVNQ